MANIQLPQSPHILFLLASLILSIQLFLSNGEISDTIVLHPTNFSKIKIKFDFGNHERFFNFEHRAHQHQQTSSSYIINKKDKQFDPVIVHQIINEKLEKLREYLGNENNNHKNNNNGTKEIVLFDSFAFPVNIPEYKLNVSIDTVQISGLNQFTITDIAANLKSKKISALLRIPNVRVSMFYKVNGVAIQPQRRDSYSDKGRIIYTIHGWRTVFAGKLVDITNTTNEQHQLEIAGFGMRSHYNNYDSNMASFQYGPPTPSMDSANIDIGKLIFSTVIRKVINEVDDKFENILLDHLGVREVGSWLQAKEDFSQKEEDGQLLMMESKVHESKTRHSGLGSGSGNSRRRNKRQVPCETGEELDEYVDSLFRFLKRLIRVMEPFNLPNATIELPEYNLQIFLHSGTATRVYTFERKKPAWVLCMNDTTSLGLTVGIEDARINYKYRVIQDWRLMFDGDLEAQLRKPKAQLQITQLAPPESDDDLDYDEGGEDEEESQVQQRVDKLKVWRPGQINVLIRGLGNFSSALSMLINQMLSDTSMLEPIIRMIETDGVVAANEMLRNVSIPIFSII